MEIRKMGLDMTKFAAAGLMACLLLAGTAAQAAGGACQADLQRLCPNQTGHALKHCRNANHASFSSACHQSLAASHQKLKDLKK
jgi:hypothetical protein